MADLKHEIERRRTFAIISHPDAGKTTLTEKFLLYGGAISLAGAVKGKKNARHATSDWMEIEKQRGISVTSSVMQFNYEGYCINILDTPGHQDFSEDTYRTLMAADSAVMVIDAAKGVENQTRKLFKVCTLRNIPIFTFINKMDRESRNPFDLLEEIENELGIRTYPVNWPIGSGKEFKGVYDRENRHIISFEANNGTREVAKTEVDLNDENLAELIGNTNYNTLRDDVELLDGASEEFDAELVNSGKLSPVFFGSALTNFGVEPFLENFLKMTTPPLPRTTEGGIVDPFDESFSAFIFKIQANMNKAHRDRIAFMRIVSGKFDKDMEVMHVQNNRVMRLSQPQQIMANDREVIQEAYAGDIMGVFDPGVFSIGDTVCAPKSKVIFEGIPTFAPEHFARIRQKDTLKRKQFIKGTTQIAQEGAIQIFSEPQSGFEEVIVGVVGVLQFEVLEYRLKNEYNVDIIREDLSYEYIRWITSEKHLAGGLDELQKLILTSDTKLIQDVKGNYLLIFTSEWNIKWALDKNEGLELAEFNRD
ncbi:MAG: peptide chain release factor 3 [Oscillospiraceae bacterium]|nr:peptide chain release factor 3 [Oscillospiraceae bacterium]